jgi:TolA-binding protein
MIKPRLACGLLSLSGFMVSAPELLHAQRREDILSIQRDVAQLQDQVAQMRAAQDQKLASIEAMLKQAMDESGKLAASMSALERTMTDRMNQQQVKLEAPVANLGTKVDQVSDEVRVVRESVTDLAGRIGSLDSKLADISSAIRTLSTPPAAPPSATPSTSAAPTTPAGISADVLFQNATRDRSSGKDQLAMTEFLDFVKYFPQSENAPSAQFYIGYIYYDAKQFPDAAQAFDAVLERFPENPKTPDALYMKGVSLMNAGKRTDAAVEFKDFLSRYPNHSLAPKAIQYLRTLGMSTTPVPRARKKAN